VRAELQQLLIVLHLFKMFRLRYPLLMPLEERAG
jgi:hypothetical protein